MTKTISLAVLTVIAMQHGHCAEVKATAFEVAAIKPCAPGTPAPSYEHTGMVEFTSPGGRFRADAVSVRFLMEWAYDILPAQHAGGPGWLETERYDIAAKAAGNATDDEMKAMVRTMLAERFQLKLHHETKELQAYVITLGKTAPKLYAPKEGETHSLRVAPEMDADKKIGAYKVVATKFSLVQLTNIFARHLDSVLVNETGLNGEFDFTLELAPDESRPNPLDASLILSAMREQLGLTVKAQKTAVDFLVVEGAEKAVVN